MSDSSEAFIVRVDRPLAEALRAAAVLMGEGTEQVIEIALRAVLDVKKEEELPDGF